uniref:Contactin associated protein like 3 n=1 Tax=Oryzias sinensis TaxID=183150 RepID=A0A8C8DBJ1_9TELE
MELGSFWLAVVASLFQLKTFVCDRQLVASLPQSSFRSSSQLSSSHAPGFAKLNRRDGAGGWSPLISDRHQWLEVDLGKRTRITAIATQGRYGSSDWLTSYLLMFSDTGHNWKQYRQEDSLGSFPGNSNADSVVQHQLQQPVIARFLRLVPLDWNPSGRIGLRLETYGCPYTSDVMSFDGSSSALVYRPNPGSRETSRDVLTLKFKTLTNSGMVLQVEEQEGHVLSLELDKGKLLLVFRKGRTLSSQAKHLISLGGLLDDQLWHYVKVERHSSHLNLTVDKLTERINIHAFCCFTSSSHFSLLIPLPIPCMFSFFFSQGNVTFSCAESVSVAVTLFGSQSFLQLPGRTASSPQGLSVGFQFRTWNKVGLLLTFNLPQQGGGVWLYLSEAKLHLQIHKTGKLLSLEKNDLNVASKWHLSVADSGNILKSSKTPFSSEWISKAALVILINVISIPLSLSACEPADANLIFVPPAVYERSCEAYKHNGNTSGYFYIDVDGSGMIKPQLVYCNMTEQKTWMMIHHNNTELTRVQPGPGVDQHLVHFSYPSEEEQLLAAISQSQQCEQELSYRCRKSRLLNTPEGSPFSWWLGGPSPGRVQTYWGGAHPGSQQCACGLQGNCVDLQHYCNCDADRSEWTEDAGLVTHKESLPVRSLVLGDVHRPDSEGVYRVGPLRCHGDKNFWNAAFFDKETSYLHFPTFHGELSAEISFLFKTTASSGVFLENLGIKDFIRIKLSSSSRVVFSLDVGNGPLEVYVNSSIPLNDNRWHRVRAERNIKEATLRVDDLPVATQAAPADGHFSLQLNSQLFIGGTASRQKGFRGCIRSLQLNGATLDLEERAKITPGVRPGCPGHCSSYGSLCHHQGRCVEKDDGFHCDCSQSAYSGVFCHTEVSASFRSGTSLSYIFKEPFEGFGNSSVLPSSVYSDLTLKEENVSLSFRTTQSPALLLHISSSHGKHLALLINKHGEEKLEVRYKLDSSRDAEVLWSSMRNLANGQLHSVTVQRRAQAVLVQVRNNRNLKNTLYVILRKKLSIMESLLPDYFDHMDPYLARLASLGFTGCLSVVQFNSINPLKAALLHPDTSPVHITGPLVQSSCGSAASAKHHAPGSVGSGQPLVNAIRTDSALIGGSELFVCRALHSKRFSLSQEVEILFMFLGKHEHFLQQFTDSYTGQFGCGRGQGSFQKYAKVISTAGVHLKLIKLCCSASTN